MKQEAVIDSVTRIKTGWSELSDWRIGNSRIQRSLSSKAPFF